MNEYLRVIKNIDLFSEIDDNILEAMLESFTLVELNENEFLFQQGDKSDSLYISLSGHFISLLKTEKGEINTLNRIQAGEIIGEIGLLSKKPRNISIKALTPCKLLKLTDVEFSKLIKLAPDVVYQILLKIIMRGQNKLNTMSLISQQVIKKSHRHIVIAAANDDVDLHIFFETLKSLTIRNPKIFFLPEEKMLESYQTKGVTGLIEYLDKLEKNYFTIIYHISEKVEQLLKFVLKRADLVTLVGKGNALPKYSHFVCRTLEHKDVKEIKKGLALLWPHDTEIKNTQLWLNPSDFEIHHHIIETDLRSYERLLRFYQGTSVGLVLGGGAARGWVHVGVIRALRDKNIPIDAIGGTSSGAGVAGFYLMASNETDFIEHVKQMRDGVNHSISWFSFTAPVISFYNASRATSNLKSIFQEKHIENLTIPFFAVSSNVSTLSEYIHRSGKVWKAVRASAAIPAFFPPLVDNGQLHYDGGLMNNLPVDKMRKILGPNATIIASDLEVSLEDKKQYYFPPDLSIPRLIRSKLGLTDKKYIFPNFFSTILKSMLMGSLQKSQDNIALADYYIHPDLKKFNLMSLEEASEMELIESGYQNALAILKDYR